MQMGREWGLVSSHLGGQREIDPSHGDGAHSLVARLLAETLRRLGVDPGLWPHLGRDGQGFVLGVLRQTVAEQIERGIALLDLIDGDPDFEPESGEPEMGTEDPEWAGLGPL